MRSFFSEAVFSKYGARSQFFSGSSLPLKMFNVAEQCVMMSWLVRELAHRYKAMRSSQKLGELNIERGVFNVFVNNRNLK